MPVLDGSNLEICLGFHRFFFQIMDLGIEKMVDFPLKINKSQIQKLSGHHFGPKMEG
jgi:hypothetical protein